MYGDERASAAMCLFAESGLRPETLGNDSGKDGLTILDLSGLGVYKDRVAFAESAWYFAVFLRR